MPSLVDIASINNKKHVENHVETILTDISMESYRGLFQWQCPNYLNDLNRIRCDTGTKFCRAILTLTCLVRFKGHFSKEPKLTFTFIFWARIWQILLKYKNTARVHYEHICELHSLEFVSRSALRKGVNTNISWINVVDFNEMNALHPKNCMHEN
jgi:hypothetical protein